MHKRGTQDDCLGVKDLRFWIYLLSWKETMHLFAAVCIMMTIMEEVDGFCPSQCSCIYHGMSDGTRTRYLFS